MKGRKVAKLIDGSNFIDQNSLLIAKITPKDMEEFLIENNLTWAVMDLGSWLGLVAFFYNRLPEDESTTKENPAEANRLDGDELLKIKAKYEKKPQRRQSQLYESKR